MFSVIIPTLQRSARTSALLEMYASHKLVDEVVVINNAPARIDVSTAKVRVLNQTENIYVHPAWNLGVSVAQTDRLIISNDDISFNPRLIDSVARILDHPVGVVGPHPRAFSRDDRRIWFTPSFQLTPGFGTLMFLRRESYVEIPEDLLVWWGDQWLFTRQRHRNIHIRGVGIRTEMSTTSSSKEFSEIKAQDSLAYRTRHRDGDYLERFGLETIPARTRIQLEWRWRQTKKIIRKLSTD